MRNSAARKTLTRLAGVGLVAGCAAAYGYEGYVADSSGSIVSNSAGECVHDSSWSSGEAGIPGCDGYLARLEAPAAAPEPIQMAKVEPEPEPVVRLETVTLDSRALFGFDEATLRPEAQEELDQLAERIGSYPHVVQVEVAGHTDRIGPADYNEELSRRRAEAVADYLRSRTQVSQADIKIRAAGESEPVVQCENTGSAQALIECLQPNRRVVVDVSAQRRVTEQR